MIRAYRYPLKPTKDQEVALDRYLWRCRQVYNAALEQRRDAYRKQHRSLSKFDQQKDLTELRQNDPDFKSVPATVLRSGLKRLDDGYQAFFRRVKAGEKPGFPRFKGRDRYKSFSFMRAPLIDAPKIPEKRTRNSRILIPKLGWVLFHQYRPLKGTPKDAVVRRDSTGRWWVSIVCDLGEAPRKIVPVTHTGIDVGLTTFATLADGSEVPNHRFFREGQAVLAQRQQSLARKTRGSSSRQKQKVLVAKAHEHVKNQRLDFARKLAVFLFSRYDLVSYEDLNIRGMLGGYLSKSIMDAAWGILIHALVCKAEEAGKYDVAVDPTGTTQRCSRCTRPPTVKLGLGTAFMHVSAVHRWAAIITRRATLMRSV